jgi:hypothetical protein
MILAAVETVVEVFCSGANSVQRHPILVSAIGTTP